MDLHPYDGVERCFRHTDAECIEGVALVAHLLHLSASDVNDGALYDLSFYSGGIGIIDRLAITLPATATTWAQVAAALDTRTPEEASLDDAWADELAWLFTGEEEPVSLRAAAQFINNQRREFQRECHATSRIYFGDGSGVNWWLALWGDATTINYLSYDQG